VVAGADGSDETLENTYLMRLAGRFSRRVRGYAKAHAIPVIDCSVGQRCTSSPKVVSRLKGVLERFADALSCIDQCFITDEMLEQLPTASQVGKTIVGGIDLNKPRIRLVVEAVIALSPSPNGSTAPISPLGCAPSAMTARHNTVRATPIMI
jgi:hypothetical protein